jgi:hypothetical protein
MVAAGFGADNMVPLSGASMSGTLNLQGTPPLVMPTGAAAGYVLTTDGSGNVSPQPAPVLPLVASASVYTSAHTGAGGEYARVDASAGNIPVTLPTAPANNTTIGVKQIAVSGSHATTVTCGGSDALNKTGGSTSYTLTLPNQGVVFQYQTAGAYWLVTADNLPLGSLDTRYGQIAQANAWGGNAFFKGPKPWFDLDYYGGDSTGATDSTVAFNSCVAASLDGRYSTTIGLTSGTTVNDTSAVAGDLHHYINSSAWATGYGYITSVTPGASYIVSVAPTTTSGTVSAFIGYAWKLTSAVPIGKMRMGAGVYKVTSDLIIRSVYGFYLAGQGNAATVLSLSGGGFTQAGLFLDGHSNGIFRDFAVYGDGTEGTASSGVGGGVPDAIRVDWTTAAARSTSGNQFDNITITNLKFVTGFSMEGTGATQLDGEVLRNVIVHGSQQPVTAGANLVGTWSTSARTDTGCSTNSTTTVLDSAAATGDINHVISGPGIPSNTCITAVQAATGYTISHAATATASSLTFTVGTGLWQVGIAMGNGSWGNNYDHVLYGSCGTGCYYGIKCNVSGFGLFGAQPGDNAVDFWLVPNGQITVENLQSQDSGQLIVCPNGTSSSPVSFRDINFVSNTGNGYGYPVNWISIGTPYNNWTFDNVTNSSLFVSGHAPVMNLGSGNYGQGFTLIDCSQANPPSTGIVAASGVPVVAVNYQDTSRTGLGPSGTNNNIYPFYAINAGVLFQQGVASARPAAAKYGEMFYWATDTSILSHSNGSAWTSVTPSTGNTSDPLALGFTANYVETAATTSCTWAALTSNGAQFLRLMSGGYTFSNWQIHVANTSGNISIAAYTASGIGATSAPGGGRQSTTGAIACPANGDVTIPIGGGGSITPLLTDWVGMSADNTTISVFSKAAGQSNFLSAGLGGNQTSAHPCPATPSLSISVYVPFMIKGY